MKNTFGLIVSGTEDNELRDLTMIRSIAAVPIAGRYRIIDFYLSNLVNSGISNVGVITHKNYHSIMDHIFGGVEWDLSRKRDGLFVFPPMLRQSVNSSTPTGSVQAISGVRDYITRSSQETCILHTNCRTIFNTTYHDAYKYHKTSGADITIMYHKSSDKSRISSKDEMRLILGKNSWVTDIFPANFYKESDLISMDTFFINKNTLLKLVDDCLMRGGKDFTRDILMYSLNRLDVNGYFYDKPAYKIDTSESFFKTNLAFLNNDIRKALIYGDGPIYTKVRDEVPARYGKSAKVANSLLADGCIIEGSVENSLLFRGVQVSKGAVIKNCIIMQGSQVQENVLLENVILDKNCIVLRGRHLNGTESYPIVITKGSIV